jgi:hypothetical protein
LIATYQWRSQAPTAWENLQRYRFELGLVAAGIMLAVMIFLHLDRETPSVPDIERSLQTYVQMLRSSRSVNGGSLRAEMQADVTGPRVIGLDITEQRRFIDYWTIDATMHVEAMMGSQQAVPIRLRVAYLDGEWKVLQAEDLSRNGPLRQ